jgi:hypothetical protein
MAEEKKLIIDEDWKEEAQKEKEALAKALEEEKQKGRPLPGPPNFMMLVSGLATQALMGLGEMENPFTGKRERNLEEARFHIDMIEILEQKTQGNLTEAEARAMESLLYDLRLRFVDAAKQTA